MFTGAGSDQITVSPTGKYDLFCDRYGRLRVDANRVYN